MVGCVCEFALGRNIVMVLGGGIQNTEPSTPRQAKRGHAFSHRMTEITMLRRCWFVWILDWR